MKKVAKFDESTHWVNMASKFKVGDKVKTAAGDIETISRIKLNGNIETKENSNDWSPDHLKLIESAKDAILTKKEKLLVKEYANKLIKKRKLTEDLSSDELDELAGDIAQKTGWDGIACTEIYLESLTECNFHSERRKLTPILNKIFDTEFK